MAESIENFMIEIRKELRKINCRLARIEAQINDLEEEQPENEGDEFPTL